MTDSVLTDREPDVAGERSAEVTPPPTEPPARDIAWDRVARAVGLGAYAGALFASIRVWGVPLARETVLAWVMGGLVVASIGRPKGGLWRVVRDWLPFGAVLVVYDLTRGVANDLGTPVHYRPQIEADKVIGFGDVPTVWLQRHVYDFFRVQWWELALSILYVSHFVVPFVVAAWLWLRDRDRWAQYTRRFVTLSFMAAATFVLYPAAPPWLAGHENEIPRVIRTASRGWEIIDLHTAKDILELGWDTSNVVAAVPSLHAAWPLLVAWVLWPRAPWWFRSLMVLYVLSMGFMLVITGEHFVIDILIGWLYVAVCVLAWTRIERWWRGRRERKPNSTADLAETES